MSIPVLDHTDLDPSALATACEDWGFFALVNHGVSTDLLDSAYAQMRRFFAQSTTVKNRIRRTADNSWGFYDAELTKNKRDWKEIVDIGAAADSGPLAGSYPQWPEQPGFKDTFLDVADAFHQVAMQLVEAIAKLLSVDNDVTAAFADHSSFLRLNYYPICDAADDQLGISRHTDAGAVTVLWQDPQPGLQVYSGAAWHTVEPVPGGLIINVGDIVQVWSNDRFRAPLHRVLAQSTMPRYSLPYFLNPNYAYDYAPLGTQLPLYKPINWGHFRSGRSAGDYADHGAEIQISDFLVANCQL